MKTFSTIEQLITDINSATTYSDLDFIKHDKLLDFLKSESHKNSFIESFKKLNIENVNFIHDKNSIEIISSFYYDIQILPDDKQHMWVISIAIGVFNFYIETTKTIIANIGEDKYLLLLNATNGLSISTLLSKFNEVMGKLTKRIGLDLSLEIMEIRSKKLKEFRENFLSKKLPISYDELPCADDLSKVTDMLPLVLDDGYNKVLNIGINTFLDKFYKLENDKVFDYKHIYMDIKTLYNGN